ncbi:hypothetical protein [Usitatibacter palustris]|uniref:Uncharacterized protein n=1 Tax=Usitatibacter palustris TaxID=2732487 RepID=A0A6M4HDW5_9PROT|nr:hypothetical protein [Usitatibacter palustris]QJR16167.1 hypothetical protein DSM104440_02996 [Usitatibacter palustris]
MKPFYPLVAAGLALAGCSEPPPPKPADTATRMEQAAKQMGEAARKGDAQKMGDAALQMGNALTDGTKTEPTDHRKLRTLLPESIAGLQRTSSEGQKTNVMGVASSKALGVYEDGKGARLELEIIDIGTFTGVAAMAFNWLNVEIDKEGDDGYERTSKIAGRKAYERYSRKQRAGELDVMVAGRFVVTARGTNLDMKTFRAAVDAIDLAKLDAMK